MFITRTPLLFALLSGLLLAALPISAARHITPFDGKGAIIFAYHRIGEDGFPDTNLRISLFKSHIKEILTGDYNIMPVPKIIETLKNEEAIPPKTLGITFEGGHKSILENAVPLLLEHDLPFTVFISTDKADWNSEKYMNWRELKKLAENENVNIGVHPASYTRLAGLPENRIAEQINRAKGRYREELGKNPELFAYPFGEYSLAYRNLIANSGFEAAFGQQSGVAWPGSDFFALPRFTMTDSFADLERFRLTANALPLPVSQKEPEDFYLANNNPVIGFTVHDSLTEDLGSLSCFSSTHMRPRIETIGSRVELRHTEDLRQSRIRINCTIPGPSPVDPDETPRWRWFGMLLSMPDSIIRDMEEDARDSGNAVTSVQN